ncbi:MAG: carbon starvation protein A [Bacteroides sp.]|nr:carbon starvation protein A [Bacteroides sp.]
MITFTLCLLALVAGYFIYGRFVERVFGPDNRKTPALTKTDGVDYIPLPTWKIFMIQFLNIAGLGPIFGAIMGAQFGTASYLWIVLGTIFAGAVHDFFSGTLSIRHDGESLPEIIGRYLGKRTKTVSCLFTMILMILVGAVFVSGPAELLAGMTPDYMDAMFWIVVIFLYYVLATLLPIDKIIGKIYPLFAFALLFMAVGILAMLYVKSPELPEMWNGFGTKFEQNPIFPMMFISIACGAISGFHATQSPLMARCLSKEKHCRPVFYGAMITEGIVALIWAAAATYFFHENGIVDEASGRAYSGAMVATQISKDWLGAVGGVLAILGIVAAPITSGDTALRSARLIAADFLHIEQRSMRRRLLICVPIFLLTIGVLVYSLSDAEGFKIIWRYFAWCNQTLAVFTLWAITVYLTKEKPGHYYLLTLIPAVFMSVVCTSYIAVAPEGFGLPQTVAWVCAAIIPLVTLPLFYAWRSKYLKGNRLKNYRLCERK